MANTFTQLHIHVVFAVKYRAAVISEIWEQRLHAYITGIVQKNGHKLLAINSVPDHMHVLIGLSPQQSISVMMRLIKGDSAEFINKNKLTKFSFRWQEGYGAFSISHNDIDRIVNYIHSQKTHHQKKSLSDEYTHMLKQHNLPYDNKYIFQQLAI
jgi:REP element-mobilizing transposase RayT